MDGIAAIYSYGTTGRSRLLRDIFLATGALQHRGKESCGIAVSCNSGIFFLNGVGRIGDVITSEGMRTLQALEPVAAIGNVGYSKYCSDKKTNAEPLPVLPKGNSQYQIAITMDGHMLGADRLREELSPNYRFRTHNQTEVLGALLHQCIEKEGVTVEAGKALEDRLNGSATFAMAALVNKNGKTYLLMLNDSHAFEPFCLGGIENSFLASSESVSHARLDGTVEREFAGAEMAISSNDGIELSRLRLEGKLADAFQAVYFGNASSQFGKREIFQVRHSLGEKLVDSYDITDADIIIPNPESGWGVTMGVYDMTKSRLEESAFDTMHLETDGTILVKDRAAYDKLKQLGSAYPGLIKHAQAVRTFQEWEKEARMREVGLKFSAIRSLVSGRAVDVGDDSIVKGSVSEGGSVWSLYNAGAKRVRLWVSYGPMFFPSFKAWGRGREALEELAVQRALKDYGNPYAVSLPEINAAVASLVHVGDVRYNSPTNVKAIVGPGSYMAMDASYPISEKFWPDWLKCEVDKYHKARR